MGLSKGEQGKHRKDNDMKYISWDRLYLVQESVRRATGNCAELQKLDRTNLGDKAEKPLEFNVHFASSGNMSNNDIRLFASQLVELTMIADELTAMKFQITRDDDPELDGPEEWDTAGSKLQKAIEDCDGGLVVAYIRSGLYEKEA